MKVRPVICLLSERFYQPNYTKKYVDWCRYCLLFKVKPQTAPLEVISITHPLQCLHRGYLSLEPGKGKEKNVLVVMDHDTRYVQAYITRSQTAQFTA